MSKTYTITDDQIKRIHNGMCSLYRLKDIAEDMFKEGSTINEYIKEVFNYIEPVKKELTAKRDANQDSIFKMAANYAKTHNLRVTCWSIFDIDSFDDESDIPVGSLIVAPDYTNQSVIVTGLGEKAKWIDLWKAVEKLSTLGGRRGFGDHVFIEKFIKLENKDNTYEVWFGS